MNHRSSGRVFALALVACAGNGFAAVTFTTNINSYGFNSLSVHEDFEAFAPKDVGLATFVSNSITYTANHQDLVVTSPGYVNYAIGAATTTSILAANGDEDYNVAPGFAVKRMGFDVYTINEPGNPNSVPGANDVLVTVYTASGPTFFNLPGQPGNMGFLGIISDENILSVDWYGNLGGVKNTGIDNIRVSDVVPEPATLAALALGAGALFRRRRR